MFWLDGDTCRKCFSGITGTCNTCFGSKNDECSSCTGSLFYLKYKCIAPCDFHYWGAIVDNFNYCLKRCPKNLYTTATRTCCLGSNNICIQEITSSIIYSDKLNNIAIIQFSRPFSVSYAQTFARVLQLSMQNIDSFTSTITPLDQVGDFVSKLKIVAKPNESVMYSELLIDLLTDYICDEFGVPHSKTVKTKERSIFITSATFILIVVCLFSRTLC